MPPVAYDYRLPFPAVRPHAAKRLNMRLRQAPLVNGQPFNGRVRDDVVLFFLQY
jgi:hypothetical protein